MNFFYLLIVWSSVAFAQISAPAIHLGCYDTEDPVQLGKPNTYVIVVRNEGTMDCKDLQLVNIFPEGATFIKSSMPFLELSEKSISFFHPTLESGEQLEYKITVKMGEYGSLKNQAILKYGGQNESFLIEESTCVTLLPIHEQKLPALHASMYDTEDPILLGMKTTYVIEVRNEGTAILEKIVVATKLAPNTKFISASETVGFSIHENQIVFSTVEELASGEKLLYKITVAAEKEGVAKLTTSVKCASEKINIITEESTTIVNLKLDE